MSLKRGDLLAVDVAEIDVQKHFDQLFEDE
jgi:hypothetical protein